ncbi:MAG: hypothetical protein GTO40_06580 [Deltaproteobacteria bacterium]|nr:hypothetical protein [Deltaproteobacteria bacterium]
MSNLEVQGINHISVTVSDLKKSEEFYGRSLGLEPAGRDLWPQCGASQTFHAGAGQFLILSETTQVDRPVEIGTHQAYRISESSRDLLVKDLRELGIEVHTYKEDRPQEEKDNLYFYDPDGNRVQLVTTNQAGNGAARVQGIDHAAAEVVDLEWAENFYISLLGLPVDVRVGWSTADYARAKRWGEGLDDMAPGTRRWDALYTENRRRVPRVNSQLFIRFGDSVLGIYLATKHRQEPPEEQAAGSPHVAFRAQRTVLDEIARLLEKHDKPFEGPVDHPASVPVQSSLYLKDPGGNFLELVVPR